jgi:hypothetical protein
VHPGPPGQAIMAWAILKGLNFPSQVASVEIDAAGGKVTSNKNCEVKAVTAADGGVRFEQLDAALPFFPNEAKSILKWAPILEELNDYQLKVTGLKPGKYEVRLGGKRVTEASAEELAKGMNLAEAALSAGPVAEQVKAVWDAVVAKNKYYHDQIFRGVVLAQANVPDFLGLKITKEEIESKRQTALAERMSKMPELDAAIRKALELKPHTVEIVPAKG